MYKTFDWEKSKKETNIVKFNYLKNYHNQRISEEQFVSDWKQFKKFSKLNALKGQKNKHTSERMTSRYSASALRGTYRRLQRNFGFFIGDSK